MRTQEQINEIVRLLLAEYPQADCTLDWRKDYELLFSVRLAAQCTDERVNKITPALFERFPTLEAFAEEELTALPGVGRKTANLILGDVFKIPGSTVVDTHCIRLTNRMGIVDDLKDPVKIEMELRKLLPPEHSSDFCHCLVLHGRAVCPARKPECERCCVRHLCRSFSG